jgi:hypothetical protein
VRVGDRKGYGARFEEGSEGGEKEECVGLQYSLSVAAVSLYC